MAKIMYKIREMNTEEYNELENGKKYASSERTQITEMAIIRSSAEFFGVQFTDCFSAKNRVYVCAFIHRGEAFKVYESEIKQNSDTVAALLSAPVYRRSANRRSICSIQPS